jgi:xylan 1,4-beta-xylosidase
MLLVAGVQSMPAQTVSIQVDANKDVGPLRPVWSYFGYDEPNYTYMKDGKKLLSELAALSPATVYVRTHNLLTTGDGTPALKWGSTNAYTEDAAGNPRYDWTIIDRIFDTFIERGMKPIVQLGFMPQALSVKPTPYQHSWSQDKPYADIFTGWAYPPKDYDKWRELAYQWAKHSVDRYGRREVESWYWEVWNEPNIGYWRGTPEEYNKLYDYAVDGVKRALSTAKVGGPHATGPSNEGAAKFLNGFLQHVTREKNHATGRVGSPIDFVAFHAKGRPRVVDKHVQMGSDVQLRNIDKGFEIIASYPELKGLPIIIGESDPEGCAACSVRFNPQNNYRNGTMYPSYTAATFARKYDLAARHMVNFEGAVTWAFEFEGQPYFDGYRDLATNGIDKPVLNVFRMFGMMGPQRIEARSSGAIELDRFLKEGAKSTPDVGTLASRDDRAVTVMIWNYHDDDLPAPAADIEMTISGLPSKRIMAQQYRVDGEHGNSYEIWKKMGSPQKPSEEQYAQLERAGQLDMVGSPEWRNPTSGRIPLRIKLPRQGVALVKLVW